MTTTPLLMAQEKEKKPYIKNLKKGERAPFEGVLIEPWGLAQIMSEIEFQDQKHNLELEYQKKILTKEFELKLNNLELDLSAERKMNKSINGNMEDYIGFLETAAVNEVDISGWELILGYAAGTLVTVGIVWGLNTL